MLRRTMFVALAFALAMAAGTAFAQSACSVGAYKDDVGSLGGVEATRDLGATLATFDVYYILYTEDFTNAVAWNREVAGLGTTFSLGFFENGTFLDVQPEGYRLGIGNCVIGFGGVPIVLARETIGFFDDFQPKFGTVTVTANTLEDPQFPLYNTCADQLVPCSSGEVLAVTGVVANESESWGSVKALFNSN